MGELPLITASTFTTRSPNNTPLTNRASTSANPNLVISPAFVEANYEVLESLLRDRRCDNHDLSSYSCAPNKVSTCSETWRKSRRIEEALNRDGSKVERESEGRRPLERRRGAMEEIFLHYSQPIWEEVRIGSLYSRLQPLGSFRSSTTHQSSILEKIIHKLSSRNKKTSYVYQNSYHELEAAYVAQICLTWEALNWNYNYFQQLRASRRESDPGCPAYIAQQFQQFQVVLQRYIENEPYQNGRRPIVFARMRSIAPKLLQVPEYRDSDDEKKDEYLGSRISSESFLVIMDESIKTFMNFLRADKENHFHKFTAHFFPIKNPKTSVDPTHILLLKKLNHKVRTPPYHLFPNMHKDTSLCCLLLYV
ncbi:putative ribosomal protein L34Ae [Tanacetum coccineum]